MKCEHCGEKISLADSQKEGHGKVWDNLNDGTMTQSNVECMEMIDVVETNEIPKPTWARG